MVAQRELETEVKHYIIYGLYFTIFFGLMYLDLKDCGKARKNDKAP